jgi:hypothetical protein
MKSHLIGMIEGMGHAAVTDDCVRIAGDRCVSPEVADLVAGHADHAAVDVLEYDLSPLERFSSRPVFIQRPGHGKSHGGFSIWPVTGTALLAGIMRPLTRPVILARYMSGRGRLPLAAVGRKIR